MFKKFRAVFALPACLLVASSVVVFTVIAETGNRDDTFANVKLLSFEESSRVFGWPDVGNLGTRSEQNEFAPVAPIWARSTRDPNLIFTTFRGVEGRIGDSWRFDQVLARHEIELRSDPNELANIQLAARALDSYVIMPGETFSFNEQVGVRSEEKGYKPGLMFSQGQVIKGIGGGICVASTALYNAALMAGLKIIERSPHSAIPSYAGPGFDAAVVYRTLDLKVKNDTRTPVLVRCTFENDIFALTLLGKRKPGLEVELQTADEKEIPYKIFEKPDPSVPEGEVKVKQAARPGCEVALVRLFKQNGEVVKREVVCRSCYLPRHKIVLIPMPKTPDAAAVSAPAEGKPAVGPHCPATYGAPHPAQDVDKKPVGKWEVPDQAEAVSGQDEVR